MEPARAVEAASVMGTSLSSPWSAARPEEERGRRSAPRFAVPFAEIGSLPRRDRSSSAPRSVHFRAEIGSRSPTGCPSGVCCAG
ncbi:MAG: hypothetical protein DI576_00645 [Actinomyces sp.]|nr:MAG: hypothetical protein DI576_00645 [Actinomyces sp.]